MTFRIAPFALCQCFYSTVADRAHIIDIYHVVGDILVSTPIRIRGTARLGISHSDNWLLPIVVATASLISQAASIVNTT